MLKHADLVSGALAAIFWEDCDKMWPTQADCGKCHGILQTSQKWPLKHTYTHTKKTIIHMFQHIYCLCTHIPLGFIRFCRPQRRTTVYRFRSLPSYEVSRVVLALGNMTLPQCNKSHHCTLQQSIFV